MKHGDLTTLSPFKYLLHYIIILCNRGFGTSAKVFLLLLFFWQFCLIELTCHADTLLIVGTSGRANTLLVSKAVALHARVHQLARKHSQRHATPSTKYKLYMQSAAIVEVLWLTRTKENAETWDGRRATLMSACCVSLRVLFARRL